jgi:hypothetical protein
MVHFDRSVAIQLSFDYLLGDKQLLYKRAHQCYHSKRRQLVEGSVVSCSFYRFSVSCFVMFFKSFVTKAYYCHLFLLCSNSLDNISLNSFSMVGNITQWAINLLMFKSPNCFAIWVILIIILSFLS